MATYGQARGTDSSLTNHRTWDEERVAEWLRSINCSQYVSLFLKNNITGSNLMELDAASLKEMGILKMGDRKRIEAQAKKFRASEYKRISKRVTNRVCRRTVQKPWGWIWLT
jgi:mitogen-activated protein kinase kinase kinase